MKVQIFVLLLSLGLLTTSCSLDDMPIQDIGQETVQSTDGSDSSPTHQGDDDELEPNG